MMLRSIFARLLVVSAAAFVVALVVVTKLNRSEWSGRQFAQMADGGMYGDGWLRDQATLSISGFSTIANVVELSVSPARLAPDGPPRIAVSVCGGQPAEIDVLSIAPHPFAIPSGCSPLQIKVQALNSFVLHEPGGDRTVGAQVNGLKITSALGFPLFSLEIVLESFCAMALLALCAYWAPGAARSWRLSAALGALGAAALVLYLGTVEVDKYFPLYVLVTSVLGGMALFSACKPEELSQERQLPALWLLVIVALGAALRFYGIDFGLPAHFHPDEVPKVNAIMRMVEQNTWNPQYFLHPSLLLYSTYGMNSLLHLLGFEGGFRDTAYLAGRLVSATAGTLSIALTFAIGRRLFSRNIGLTAAALLAVLPLHVTCSRYLKEDALLTFVALSCVLSTLIAVQSRRYWVLLVAGLLAGTTAGTKYSGILLAVVPASAPWLASRTWKPDLRWAPWAIAAVCIAPLGFLATTPFALIDSAKFLKDFAAESRHMQTGHTNTIDPWSQLWMYHFYRSIVPGMTPVLAIASAMGLGLLLRRAKIEGLFIVAVALLFYLPAEFVKAKPAPQPERYIVPCLPFLAIALAALSAAIGRSLRIRHGALLCGLVLLAAPFSRTISLAGDLKEDTRDQMAIWMRQHIPAEATVLMDWKPYCPQLTGAPFKVEHIERARIIPELDPSVLRNSGADYLVLSSLFYARYFNQPESNPTLRQRIRDVFQMIPIVAQYRAPSGVYGFHNPVLTLFSLRKEDFARLDMERTQKLRGEISETSNEVRARVRW